MFIEPAPSAGDGARNYDKALSHRPEVHEAYDRLGDLIKDGMDLRRYELATIAAARRLRSSYCMLAHGSVLVERFMAPAELRAIVADHRDAGLDEVDVAVMDLAERVVDDATAITDADLDRLRQLGLSDRDILDVVLAAAQRCFFSKVLDAVGTQPDRGYVETVEPELREALTVGRPIAGA